MQFSSKDLSLCLNLSSGIIEFKSSVFDNSGFFSRPGILINANDKSTNLFSLPWSIERVDEDDELSTPIGNLTGGTVFFRTELPGVMVTLRMGLSPNQPFGFLQTEVVNNGDLPLTIERMTILDCSSGDLHLGGERFKDPAFFSNGWQSWSNTGAYGLGEKMHSSIIKPFQNPMMVNHGTPVTKKRDHFSSDMFAVLGDRASRIGLLAGFLSQKQHFGSLDAKLKPSPSLKMWANGDHAHLMPGSTMKTDWAVIQFIDLDKTEPLSEYYQSVALVHEINKHPETPLGWCSWYHYYEDITHEAMQSNLDAVAAGSADLPLTLFQIDDGFETRAGDWFDFDQGFPNGLKPLVKTIKSEGLTPGLWLAPYIVHPKAALVKEHPDWLLKNERGTPVNAGFVWNSFTYGLDLTNPDALEYTCNVIRTAVEQWGFEYLKLDFLYAGALDGEYHDQTLTRAQVLRSGLNALREAAGSETCMLACGCPLGSALGIFEAMRIGADVSGFWEPHFPPVSPILRKEPNMPSARNALQNVITRAPLHQHWWINDPDCLLVRSDTDLTLAEVRTLTTAIGLTGGSLLLSDDLPALSEERIRLAQALIPLIGKRALVLDWFDTYTPSHLRVDLSGPTGDWHLLAFFNWHDNATTLRFTPQEFKLSQDQTWWLREFWTGAIGQMDWNKSFSCSNVPPHGVRVMAARRFRPNTPTYLGSDLHLSQGMEINTWQVKDHEILLGFDLGRQAAGKFDLYLPWQPDIALIQKKSIPIIDKGSGIYEMSLQSINSAQLRIKRQIQEEINKQF